MPLIHIVLLKVKSDIWEKGNGKEELITKLNGLSDLPCTKKAAKEAKWGPPVYGDRSKGWNYGLYSVFDSRASYEAEYRDDADHREFVKTVIAPNVDEVMAYDFEV